VTEQDGSSIAWTYDDAYRLLTETRTAAGGSGGGSSTPTATATNTGGGSGNGTPTFVPPSATAPSGATSTPNATATPGATNTPVGGGGGNNGLDLPWQLVWTYDAVGNRLSQTSNGSTWIYTYNNLDQMISGGFADYTYDGRGNLATITENSALTTYTWDARDRMTGASLPSGQSVAFAYDYAGHRTQQTANGAITNYLWDELSPYGDVIQESDGTGAPVASYILGGTELVAQQRGATTAYYLHDGQGSTRVLTGVTGNALNRYVYDAFGTTRGVSGTTPNMYLYTGQQFDYLTTLYSLRARYYAPLYGRFLSSDKFDDPTMGSDYLNKYLYALSNPSNSVDPTGYFASVGSYAINVKSVSIPNMIVLSLASVAVTCVLFTALTALVGSLGPNLDLIKNIPPECVANQMQVQLQKGGATYSLVAVNTPITGVTTYQIRLTMSLMFDAWKVTRNPNWFTGSYEREWVSAIVLMSKKLAKYPPFGTLSGGNIERVDKIDLPSFGPYRLDLENKRGHNLRI